MFFSRSPHPLSGPFSHYPAGPMDFFEAQGPEYDAPRRAPRHMSSPQQMFAMDPFGRLVPVEIPQQSRFSGHRTPPATRTYHAPAHTSRSRSGRTQPGSPTHGCRGHGYAQRYAQQVPEDDSLQALLSRLEQLERQGRAPASQSRAPRYVDTSDQYDDQDEYEDEVEDDSYSEEQAPQPRSQPRHVQRPDVLSSLFGALAPYAGDGPPSTKRRAPAQAPPRPTPLRTTPVVPPKTPRHHPVDVEQMPFAVPLEFLLNPRSRRAPSPPDTHTRPAPQQPAVPTHATASAHAAAGQQQAEGRQSSPAQHHNEQHASHSGDTGSSPVHATASAAATAAAAAGGAAQQPQHVQRHSLSKSQAARIIQACWKGWCVRRQRDTLRALVRERAHIQSAEERLDQLLRETGGNITHKHCMEVQELAMRALLALDACASPSDDIRAVRKHLTKRALALQDKVADIYENSSQNMVRQKSLATAIVPAVEVAAAAAAEQLTAPTATAAVLEQADDNTAVDSTPVADNTAAGTDAEQQQQQQQTSASEAKAEATYVHESAPAPATGDQQHEETFDVQGESSQPGSELEPVVSMAAEELPTAQPSGALSAALAPVAAQPQVTGPTPAPAQPDASSLHQPEPAQAAVTEATTADVSAADDVHPVLSDASDSPAPRSSAPLHAVLFSPFKAVQETSQDPSEAGRSTTTAASAELQASASLGVRGGASNASVELCAAPAACETAASVPPGISPRSTAQVSELVLSQEVAGELQAAPELVLSQEVSGELQAAPELVPEPSASTPDASALASAQQLDTTGSSVEQRAVEDSSAQAETGTEDKQPGQQQQQQCPAVVHQEWVVVDDGRSEDGHALVSHSSAASQSTVTVAVQTEDCVDAVSLSTELSAGAPAAVPRVRRGVRVVARSSTAAQTRMLRQLLQLAQNSGLLQTTSKPRRRNGRRIIEEQEESRSRQ